MTQELVEDVLVDDEGTLAFNANEAHLKTLKICLTAAVALVILMGAAAALAVSRPPKIAIIRVDDVRGAELVKTPEAGLDIRSGEVRTALWTWCSWRYRILKSSAKQDFGQSYYFLSSQLTTAMRDADAKKVAGVLAGTEPEQTVDVRSIQIPPMKRVKSGTKTVLTGRAQIELVTSEDLTGNLGAQDLTKRHWRIEMEYVVDPTDAAKRGLDDPLYEILNPLGITITSCYETREPGDSR